MTEISDNIARARHILTEGGLVVIPTETVYGLAGNALDTNAVNSIFSTKNRPFYDPLIIHTSDHNRLSDWGLSVPDELLPLAEKYWPGPLTILVEKSEIIPDIITAGLSRVAVRIPNHKLTASLLAELDFPLAAPSANPFGSVSPSRVGHVKKYFDGVVPMILDGGPADVGIESTIVGVEQGAIVVYRLGGISIEDIESTVGSVEVRTSSSEPAAPGMLSKHYSPGKKIQAVSSQLELENKSGSGTGVIVHSLARPSQCSLFVQIDTDEKMENMAQAFYHALHEMADDEGTEEILIERISDFGLGRAINDRLKRAGA